MAETATPTGEQVPKVPLRILVDKRKNRVLFAEAGKDFVDVLLSFLTLPLGTIARLVAKESNMQPVRIGSLSSLYESVANLEEEYLCTETCKEMLLKPRNSMEAYCRKLKLNIDDTDPMKFFICESKDLDCRGLLSTFRNLSCRCGELMNREIFPRHSNYVSDGFVWETATFIICDDLSVMPNVVGTSVVLLQNLGIEDKDATEEHTVNVSQKEVLDLLKCSLSSETPLTDLFLKKRQFLDNFNSTNQSQFEIGEVPSEEGTQMVVKVLRRKSNCKIIFAQAEEDFADFLFSFLTFPLGAVLHMLEGCSSLSCMDKLYKSMAELSSERYLWSLEVRDNLANPRCAPQFKLSDQILPIREAHYPLISPLYEYIDPMSSSGETSSLGGFAKWPSMYMVTDDLVVTPMSSISGISYLNSTEVPLCDLEERVISVGLKEGLSILKASLISSSALTNGLNRFIKTIQEEN